MLDMSN